MTPHRCISL